MVQKKLFPKMTNLNGTQIDIAVIGLGHVGLPLALQFNSKYRVIGYDLSSKRISQLNKNIDITNEVNPQELLSAKNIVFTNVASEISKANIYIVTVPTPVDNQNFPDLEPLKLASKLLGNFLKKGDYVIYESTVYPGCTEEVCMSILSKTSGLSYNKDFFLRLQSWKNKSGRSLTQN